MKNHRSRWLITVPAFLLIAIRIARPDTIIDGAAVALVCLGVAPWLWEFIESAELPGGWKLRFREVESEQERQSREIESLRFLVAHFLTEAEFTHLQKLAADQPFYFQKSTFFDAELRHLRALGLIEGLPGRGVRSMNRMGGDVKEHFRINRRGLDYLRLRREATVDNDDDDDDEK
jgi:hypothetical protein